jgi:hypothetical protein
MPEDRHPESLLGYPWPCMTMLHRHEEPSVSDSSNGDAITTISWHVVANLPTSSGR